jgi:hypothetical protein
MGTEAQASRQRRPRSRDGACSGRAARVTRSFGFGSGGRFWGRAPPCSLLLLRGSLLGDRLWRVLRSPPRLHELGQALSTRCGQGSLFRSTFGHGCFLCRRLLGPAPSLTLTPPVRGSRRLTATRRPPPPFRRLCATAADLPQGGKGAVDGVPLLFEVCDDASQISSQG